MICFYFEAVRVDHGRFIELRAYNGTPEGAKHPLGAFNMTPAEWESFRPMLVAAMRWAGYSRLPVALKDQTRLSDATTGQIIVKH